MEQVDTNNVLSKVLAAGSSRGRHVQVVEYGDGSLAILLDGAETAVYRLRTGNIEACISTYMKMLHAESGFLH